jgi:hypothetical protein
MATQTQTQRKAAAQKAPATRKRNAARRRATARKAAQTRRAAQKEVGIRASAQGNAAAAAGYEATRLVDLGLGAVATAREGVGAMVKPITDQAQRRRLRTRLQRNTTSSWKQVERRGERTRRRIVRNVEREARRLRRGTERRLSRARREAERQGTQLRRRFS